MMNIASLNGLKGDEIGTLDGSVYDIVAVAFFEQVSNKQKISFFVPLAQTLLLTIRN